MLGVVGEEGRVLQALPLQRAHAWCSFTLFRK